MLARGPAYFGESGLADLRKNGLQVSPDLIPTITNDVLTEVDSGGSVRTQVRMLSAYWRSARGSGQ
ncbi:hypothetical protein [Pseudogulbenkiania ferrooxidans]|uniref:hypothetical protein n=1 Tax=Pseudogulbenkiania ferrooxidans TaxID=549169 RepID=UPI0002F599C3|nr:hypothetical protein [Pseudogulbenkiania ferrooxidans]